ncbi:MAG: thioredoxin [Dysgonamonadaceae bacterium]|jgi:thioredoxin 1|nr:thioredoxin [Dysgonamonadaceae bacterium]
MAIEITDSNFQSLIDSGKPVVADFWAEWCGPCRMIGPIIEELSEKYHDTVIIGKVNVDNNDGLSAKFGIRNIPTVLFLKEGKIVDKHVGAAQKSTLDEKIKQLL